MKNILYTLVIVILASCTQQNGNNTDSLIHIDLSEVVEENTFASTLFSDIRVVPLETINGSLLSNIREIDIYNDMVYISDALMSKILVFSIENGKFLNALSKQGKGAGEYSMIDDFIIDDDNKTIEVLDKQKREIHIYDIHNLEYITSIPFDLSFVYSFSKANDYYYFQTNGSTNSINGKPVNHDLIAFNKKTNAYYALLSRNNFPDESQAWEFTTIFNENKKGDVFISSAWSDTIYRINNHIIKPFIKVHSGKRGFPPTINTSTFQEKMAYLESNNVTNKIHFYKLLMHNEDGYIVAYGKGYPPVTYYYIHLYSVPNNSTFNVSKITCDFPAFSNQKIDVFKEDNGLVISVLYPSEIEDKDLDSLGIAITDNPILLIFTANI